jgi:hypothetical protein
MLRGSGRGIGGTVTSPAPSRPRLDWLVLLRPLRTDTEVPREVLRDARERPDIDRDEGRDVLLEVEREVPEEATAGAEGALTGWTGARPHSVQ